MLTSIISHHLKLSKGEETPCVALVALMVTALGDKLGSNSEAVTFSLLSST